MSLPGTLMHTDFHFEGQKSVYRGKVREVYTLENDLLVMIATDRLSAFDVVMPKGIPFKGQILNQIATRMLKVTESKVPNWLIATPDPNVAIGKACTPFKVEMVIRGYLAGHAARQYDAGERTLCGVDLSSGMRENDAFDTPIITPATKAEQGLHDEDISKEGILSKGIVSPSDYAVLEQYTRMLFAEGTRIAKERGLLLVDTKYEFGKTPQGEIVLIDEVHTPDSSRYFYADTYADLQQKGEPQKQLSKEFVRRWLIENNFQGLEGQILPEMTDSYIDGVSKRYIELYEAITGERFLPADTTDLHTRIESNVSAYLKL
jgi:phosphoribosylaminoimidazole-succinocarboxamide synthase